MQTEDSFVRDFWNGIFRELNAHNDKMPDVAETAEQFIKQLDDIAIEKEVSGFGYEEFPGAIGSVRATMTVNYGPGKHFQIDIRADKRFEKNTKIKIVYVELSRLHQNNKEFLTNIFFQKLPYSELKMLLDSLRQSDEKFDAALLEFRKLQKMTQLTAATIKSLLTEKFKNTDYEWKISDIGEAQKNTFVISLLKDNEEISRLVVDKTNLIQKIMGWEI